MSETVGKNHPSPGVDDLQATLLDSLHRMGTLVAGELPWPPGPRNSGQSVSAVTAARPPGSAGSKMAQRLAVPRNEWAPESDM